MQSETVHLTLFTLFFLTLNIYVFRHGAVEIFQKYSEYGFQLNCVKYVPKPLKAGLSELKAPLQCHSLINRSI